MGYKLQKNIIQCSKNEYTIVLTFETGAASVGVADICFDTWLQFLELIGKARLLQSAIGLLLSRIKTNVRYSLHSRRKFEISRL